MWTEPFDDVFGVGGNEAVGECHRRNERVLQAVGRVTAGAVKVDVTFADGACMVAMAHAILF